MYGVEGGYRYLTGLTTTGNAVCEIRDPDGDWAEFTTAVYEDCAAETRRAGAKPGRITVYGRTSLFETAGVRFTQVIAREGR